MSTPSNDSDDESRRLRHALGLFATGVTVVTCVDKDRNPQGVTANSFTSVSLEPPLLLWNIGKRSRSLQSYLSAEHFAINVMSAEQRLLCSHFAQSADNLFAGIEYTSSEEDIPLLPDALACFECRTDAIHEAGDHFIILGEIQRYRSEAQNPLLFYDGRYASIAPE